MLSPVDRMLFLHKRSKYQHVLLRPGGVVLHYLVRGEQHEVR